MRPLATSVCGLKLLVYEALTVKANCLDLYSHYKTHTMQKTGGESPPMEWMQVPHSWNDYFTVISIIKEFKHSLGAAKK
jgi:hypothetical protein